jgi:uncharacterized protein
MPRGMVLVLASVAMSAVLAAQQRRGDVEVIAAAQARLSDSFRDSTLSPFTAVASRYFTANDGASLVPDGGSYAFRDGSAPDGVVGLRFDGRELLVEALPGAPALVVRAKQGEGGVAPAGRPLGGPASLGDDQVLVVGRFFLETGARPGTGRAIVYDPDAAARRSFTGLHWFAPDPAMKVRAVYAPVERPGRVVVTTSRGLEKEFYRVGVFSFTIGGAALRLTALAPSQAPSPGEELFVAFRDRTTGGESYQVGRYLNVPFAGAATDYVLDFNLATNPYCAYSTHYNCVIPPRENTLSVAITAGEKRYH